MSYHGYLAMLKEALVDVQEPNVLEIGVDRGVTFITLAYYLTRSKQKYKLLGIDIKVQEQVVIMAMNIDRTSHEQHIELVQENSLKALPVLSHGVMNKQFSPFDVILIDGDHNYFTVQQELRELNTLAHENSIVVIDDYEGRWGTRDMFYADREGYEKCGIATQKIDTEKHGVKSAVDEFLQENNTWNSFAPVKGEPIVLYRENVLMKKLHVQMKNT